MGVFTSTKTDRLLQEERERVDLERLNTLTNTAKRGLVAFAETGSALEEIQRDELWRLVSSTWTEWCRETLGLTDRRVGQLMEAARTARTLKEAGCKLPSSERVARELASLSPEETVEVWQDAVTAADGKDPTAADVSKAARKRKPKKAGRKPATAKPVSLRVPGAAVRIVPRKNGFTGIVAALEHALEVARQREQESGKKAA
jgi:hypothetical protein